MKILGGILVCIAGAFISNLFSVQDAVTGFLVTASIILVGGVFSQRSGSSP